MLQAALLGSSSGSCIGIAGVRLPTFLFRQMGPVWGLRTQRRHILKGQCTSSIPIICRAECDQGHGAEMALHSVALIEEVMG